MVEIRGKNVHCTCSKLLLEVGIVLYLLILHLNDSQPSASNMKETSITPTLNTVLLIFNIL